MSNYPYPTLLQHLNAMVAISAELEPQEMMRQGNENSEAQVLSRIKKFRPRIYELRHQLVSVQSLVEKVTGHEYARPDPLPENNMPLNLETIFKIKAVGQWASTAQVQVLIHNGMGREMMSEQASQDSDMFAFWWTAESEFKYLRNLFPSHLMVEKCPTWKPIPTLRDGINNLIKKMDAEFLKA